MDWNNATLWWVAAGALVIAELSTGTFYLLMLALGCAAGALAAHAGAGTSTQVVVAALLGGGATALWHFKRARSPRSAPVREQPRRQPRHRRAHRSAVVGQRRHGTRATTAAPPGRCASAAPAALPRAPMSSSPCKATA